MGSDSYLRRIQSKPRCLAWGPEASNRFQEPGAIVLDLLYLQEEADKLGDFFYLFALSFNEIREPKGDGVDTRWSGRSSEIGAPSSSSKRWTKESHQRDSSKALGLAAWFIAAAALAIGGGRGASSLAAPFQKP